MDRVDPDPIAFCRALHRDGFGEQAHASFGGAIAGQTCRSSKTGD
jgi:hypothetical protein